MFYNNRWEAIPDEYIGIPGIADVVDIADITNNYLSADRAVAHRDLAKILSDQELFWAVFCRAVFNTAIDAKKKFKVVRKNDRFYTCSFSLGIYESLRSINQSLYKTFHRYFHEKQHFSLQVIKSCNTIFFVSNTVPLVLDISAPELDSHCALMFENEVLPTLDSFAQSLNVTINVTHSREKVTDLQKSRQVSREVDVTRLKIDWLRGAFLRYAVLPKRIEERESFHLSLYNMYQKEEHCDFTFTAEDQLIQLHSLVLHLSGGGVISALLASGMKETAERKISFDEYSFDTIKTYVEYLYLGVGSVKEESFEDDLNGLVQLFQFAHAYQVRPLIDHCANLFSTLAKESDADQLRELGEMHDNQYLINLAEALSAPATAAVTTGGAAGASA